MKKALLVVLALIISVAFVTTVFAQGTKVGSETKPAEKGPAPKDTGAPSVEKAGSAAVAGSGAAKAKVFKGEVVSVDAAAKTMVVKDKKGEKTFDYTNVKKMADLKAGDKVSLQYMEKEGKLGQPTSRRQAQKLLQRVRMQPYQQVYQLLLQHQQRSNQAPANKKGDLVSPFFIPHSRIHSHLLIFLASQLLALDVNRICLDPDAGKTTHS